MPRKKGPKSLCRAKKQVVYLFHLETRLESLSGQRKHYSDHYLGSALDLHVRLNQHRSDNGPVWGKRGSNFLWNCNRRGIRFVLVRTWRCNSKRQMKLLESRMKNRKNHKKFCPVCRGDVPLEAFNILKENGASND